MSVHGDGEFLRSSERSAELLRPVRRASTSIRRIAAEHGVHPIGVIGSVARGEAKPESDIDLLVAVDAGRTLFDLARAGHRLEELLGVDVDLLPVGGLEEHERREFEAEAVPLEE